MELATRSILKVNTQGILLLHPSTNSVFSGTAKKKKSDACEAAAGIQLWPVTNKTIKYTKV